MNLTNLVEKHFFFFLNSSLFLDIINFLINNGCDENERDISGKLPKDLQPSIGLNFKPGKGFCLFFIF